jgi:hypothetical protein
MHAAPVKMQSVAVAATGHVRGGRWRIYNAVRLVKKTAADRGDCARVYLLQAGYMMPPDAAVVESCELVETFQNTD